MLKAVKSKNKGLVTETFDWDDEDISNDEEETRVQVLITLADDELSVRKNHGRNESGSELQTPLPPLKNPQGAFPSFAIMTLTYQDHSSKERSGLGTMKYAKPETQESSNMNVLGPVTISNPKPVTFSVPTEVKTNDQESKINELAKLRHIKEPIWYMDIGCSRSMTGVKSYLQKYVEQPGPKVAFVNGLKYNLISTNQLCDAKKTQKCFKTKQNFSIKKYLHLLHMDLFGPVSPMSIDHKKYTLVIVDEYSRTDNETEFRNTELESFYDEKGISQKFSSPYTPKQNGVAERKNRTLIEAARIMLNGLVLSKHFWTEAVTISCYTQNKSIIAKRHDRNLYETLRERIPDISYFHVFGCHVFIHNHNDHLGKFDAKGYDGYFFGCLFNSIAFKVFNTRRQQIEKTYHVTFDESIKAIRLTQEKHVPEVIAQNEQDNPQTEDVEEPKKVFEVLKHPGWVAMQEELNQSYRNKVWTLVPLLNEKIAIGCKWVFKNKKDKHEIVTKNKARLVAQGYSQEEGIDYDETFAPVARMEAIRIFLTFATYMNFIVFQIDVKSAFLNGKIKKIYLKQPPGFESSEFPYYVCKLNETLYGLKQAPRA
nr:hypothetical protein [Tanacetum cinerariifolium]